MPSTVPSVYRTVARVSCTRSQNADAEKLLGIVAVAPACSAVTTAPQALQEAKGRTSEKGDSANSRFVPLSSHRRGERRDRHHVGEPPARGDPAQRSHRARLAIEEKLGRKRPCRGRPPKGEDKYTPVSIRLHPRVVAWAKKEAKRRRLGYQTVINEVLIKAAG